MGQVLAAIVAAWNLVKVAIDGVKLIMSYFKDLLFRRKIKEINTNVTSAQTGELDERLEAGKKVEDVFNDHV